MKNSFKIIVLGFLLLMHFAIVPAHGGILPPFDSCVNSNVIYLRFADGQFALHRSPNDTLSKRAALAWKIVSFDIMYHDRFIDSFSIWYQIGNKIQSSVLQKIRQRGGDSVCVFIDDIKARSLYTGEVMRLPSSFIKIPKNNPIDPASISANSTMDPPDSIIYVDSRMKLEQMALDFVKRDMGFFYEWSANRFGGSYEKGFGKTIWYVLKQDAEVGTVLTKQTLFTDIKKIITKKYTSLL